MVGLARAAREGFLRRLPTRKITYTAYESQRDAPLTHLQVAEASMKVDQAEFHARRLTSLVDASGVDQEWDLLDRVRARADMGATCRLAKEAVDVLASASGGSSIYEDVPMQRIVRDVQAMTLHALMNPNTNAELPRNEPTASPVRPWRLLAGSEPQPGSGAPAASRCPPSPDAAPRHPPSRRRADQSTSAPPPARPRPPRPRWGIARARSGVTRDRRRSPAPGPHQPSGEDDAMPLSGVYEPSPEKWVRDQVELAEHSSH
ncbi:hypothetical protein [Actinoalloteichus sp. AHMU CJ021]|uniref:hypothetical protein n=1 Tax=Actinoalloteichus sp. AHMU CJ021 TaxID=2072503 RepID=UPI0026A96A78